jgi:hypothetical protein
MFKADPSRNQGVFVDFLQLIPSPALIGATDFTARTNVLIAMAVHDGDHSNGMIGLCGDGGGDHGRRAA